MKMKNPPHLGEIVGDNLEALGETIKGAAEALGVTRQPLHKVIYGREALHPKWLCAWRRRSAAKRTLGCACRWTTSWRMFSARH